MSMSPPVAPPRDSSTELRFLPDTQFAPPHPLTSLRALRRELRAMDRYEPPFVDRSVLNLSLNEHPAAPSPAVQAALRSLPAELLITYDTDRAARLRAQIAKREDVEPDNVVLCAGASHALQLLFGCLDPRGTVLLPSICWSYYTTLAQLHDSPVARYQMAKCDDRFELDIPSMMGGIATEAPALVLIINPHMPTGAMTSASAIVTCAAHARGSLVLVDEAYHGFSREVPSVAARVKEHDNLVVAKTFSKFFGLAGLRLGYLIAHSSLVTHLAKALPPFGVPGIASVLASAALDSEAYYREQADALMGIKAEFGRRVGARGRLRPWNSHGNFLLLEFPDAEEAGLAEARIYQAGVAVRSARSYGMPAFLRITIGAAATMDRIFSVLQAHHGA
jgi:histidinol-phosphate aminotransferase